MFRFICSPFMPRPVTSPGGASSVGRLPLQGRHILSHCGSSDHQSSRNRVSLPISQTERSHSNSHLRKPTVYWTGSGVEARCRERSDLTGGANRSIQHFRGGFSQRSSSCSCFNLNDQFSLSGWGGGACIYTESHQYSDWGGVLELVSLHFTSMSIIGSMVHFGHPLLLRTYGISYRILPERTVRRLGIKCRVVNKSLARSDTYKISSSRHLPLRRILNIIMSWFYSVLDEIYRNESKSIKHRLSYFITHKLINLNWFSIYQLLLLYSTLPYIWTTSK